VSAGWSPCQDCIRSTVVFKCLLYQWRPVPAGDPRSQRRDRPACSLHRDATVIALQWHNTGMCDCGKLVRPVLCDFQLCWDLPRHPKVGHLHIKPPTDSARWSAIAYTE